MHELSVQRIIHISHALRLYDGLYEPVHYHAWPVWVHVSADRLDEIGAVMDFLKLKAIMDRVLDPLEGKHLNDLEMFAGVNSSSERVAEYVFKAVEPQLPPGVRLDRVVIHRNEQLTAQFAYRAPRREEGRA
jgi:6-pyruvoyltetrahydropterin/6-carboxytetrahydropterin synthase